MHSWRHSGSRSSLRAHRTRGAAGRHAIIARPRAAAPVRPRGSAIRSMSARAVTAIRSASTALSRPIVRRGARFSTRSARARAQPPLAMRGIHARRDRRRAGDCRIARRHRLARVPRLARRLPAREPREASRRNDDARAHGGGAARAPRQSVQVGRSRSVRRSRQLGCGLRRVRRHQPQRQDRRRRSGARDRRPARLTASR